MNYKLYFNSEEIIDEIYFADTFLKRLRGYMFYKEPKTKAIAIKPCDSIHTFFMRFSIDVLFLDSDMIVIKKEINLKKNKVITPIKDSKYVLETKAFGFKDISIGDVMSIC